MRKQQPEPEQRTAIERLREQVRSARRAERKRAPLISAADYLRGIEKRRAFRQSEKPSPALLEFARLADGDTARFKAKHPGYFPDEFWKCRLPADDELYQGSV